MKADIESQLLLIDKVIDSCELSKDQKSHLIRRKNFLKIVLDSKLFTIGQSTFNFIYGV